MEMTNAEIEELARRPKESAGDLEVRMTELRSRGAGILQCIIYVRLNQVCSLAQAREIVVNSRAWADQKKEFLREQQEAFEEFLVDNKDRIEAIHQTFTSDGTETVVRMKPPTEQPSPVPLEKR